MKKDLVEMKTVCTIIPDMLATESTASVAKKVTKHQPTVSLDALGVAASSLCMVHCLVLPVALLFVPQLALTGAEDITHYLLAFCVTAFCLSAIIPGFLKHGSKEVLALMLSGLSIVLFATFFAGESLEMPFITIGNILVISAHLLNRKLIAAWSACC